MATRNFRLTLQAFREDGRPDQTAIFYPEYDAPLFEAVFGYLHTTTPDDPTPFVERLPETDKTS